MKKESIKFQEYKNPKAIFFGTIIIVSGLLLIVLGLSDYLNLTRLSIVLLMGLFIISLGTLILTVNTEIEITKDFNNKYNITLFTKTIFSFKKKIMHPDYISLFGQSFSGANEYGLISSLGTDYKYDFYVIRFFYKNNKNELIFKSRKREEVLTKGKLLASLLNVELLNKLEN